MKQLLQDHSQEKGRSHSGELEKLSFLTDDGQQRHVNAIMS